MKALDYLWRSARPFDRPPRLTQLALARLACVVVWSLSVATAGAQQPRFRIDDPLWADPDRVLSIPEPTERPLSKTLDLLQKTFTMPRTGHVQAQNLNTLDEVPDSSWFTNRMSRRVMPIHELARGPNQGDGPVMTTTWLVVGAKTQGATPGLQIEDGRGDRYFIKFDPLHWPQMATSAEIVGTKFFHAFGYHVPENYLVRWRPEYEVDTDAEVLWDSGHTDRLSRGYVDDLLEGVPVRPDGTVQVVASKLLPGRPIGPFDFQGVRSDDSNDIFSHEDRRELRSLRIFCAWMNHNDSDSVNTLDMYYTKDEGRGYVMHHLIDFGSTLGSGATHPHARRVGNEYYIEFTPALKSAATFGVWDRPWRHVDYVEYPSVGRFESAYFRPESWRPDYPNPAFEKMTPQDAFWATRTVMRFSNEGIRAIVATGQYDDPAAETHVADALIERRDKIVSFYLGQINPLDGFMIDGLSPSRYVFFQNLGVEAGLSEDVECEYHYRWSTYDNVSDTRSPLGSQARVRATVVPIPASPGAFSVLRLSSLCVGQPNWTSGIDVFLRNGTELTIVGVERLHPDPS
ncbi:MAG: hypothetical protein VYE68_08870 [Acidobacteriota bacterium]|nr:hypothetical protein [Acidobacteriota bacterium]